MMKARPDPAGSGIGAWVVGNARSLCQNSWEPDGFGSLIEG